MTILTITIESPYLEGMINPIHPPELKLNKVKASDTEAPFFILHISISNGHISSKIYFKRNDFGFFIFWMVTFPYEVCMSQLFRFLEYLFIIPLQWWLMKFND